MRSSKEEKSSKRPKLPSRLRESALDRAKRLSRIKLESEKDVESYFVPDFLAMLGYRFPRDIRNAAVLDSPFYQVGSVRRRVIYPDHLVFANNRIAFVLEAKSPTGDLEGGPVGQILSYALHPDVQAGLAVLTNGLRTRIVETKRRECLLEVKQRDIPGRLRDLRLLLGRRSMARCRGELVIEKLMGRGNFGSVYRAWNVALRRREAIKIYHLDVAVSESARKRLIQGLRAQAQLSHECIAQIYRIDSEGAEVTATMQFSPGDSFHQWLKKVRPNHSQVIDVLVRVCSAVQYAHTQGIVHRDLKPSNILVEKVGRSWRPLVVDFDTAVYAGATALTRTGDAIGTLGFMAPEMSHSTRSRRLDKRSPLVDVYSLGALAFFAFFGPPPRMGISSLRASSLSRRLVGLGEEQAKKLTDTIIRAMDSEPGTRQATAERLADELGGALSDSLSMQPPTEHQLISDMLSEADKLIPGALPGGLVFRDYEANNQLGRVATIRGLGEALIAHDFDYRELMVGLSFPMARQYSAFLGSQTFLSLREIFGKALILYPPSPREDGGAFVMFELSEIISEKPWSLAKKTVGILVKFCELLDGWSRSATLKQVSSCPEKGSF